MEIIVLSTILLWNSTAADTSDTLAEYSAEILATSLCIACVVNPKNIKQQQILRIEFTCALHDHRFPTLEDNHLQDI